MTKWILRGAAAAALAGLWLAAPATAEPPSTLEIRIYGDVKLGGGGDRSGSLNAAPAPRADQPRVSACVAPTSGNFTRNTLPRQTTKPRNTCPRNTDGRL